MHTPFKVNPNFNLDSLTSTQRLWYDRLWTQIRRKRHDATTVAVGNLDSEHVGFTCREYVVAIAHALNAIGDPALFNEIIRYTNLIKNRPPYQWGPHSKDKAFLANFYSFIALLMQINGEEELREYWLKKTYDLMRVVDGKYIVPSDDLAHPLRAAANTGFYLYLLTEELHYYQQGIKFLSTFIHEMKQSSDKAAWWYKRMPFRADAITIGVERVTYLNYEISDEVTGAVLGLPTSPMPTVIKTALKCTRDKGAFTFLNDGSGIDGNERSSKQGARNFGAIIPFDSSGIMRKRCENYWNNTNDKFVNIPAFMLYT